MPTQTSELRDHFSLDILAGALSDFQPPAEPFDPMDDWQASYGVYSLARGAAPIGRLRLSRRAQSADRFALRVECRKSILGGDYEQRVNAAVECRLDALATPVRWRYSSETVSRTGEPVAHSRLHKTGRLGGGRCVVEDGRSRRALQVSGDCALSWALFEAVSRLPRERFAPLRFTLLDHFDQVKPNQQLSYREAIRVELGGERVQEQHVRELDRGRIYTTTWGRRNAKQVTLHGYDHVGHGIVPWVYWADDQGRLLFVSAGLEAYLLDSAASRAAEEQAHE
ncbi:MAG: hypothetical protein JSV65_12310 [Armatimonadota bacterium]|nr:MAG: hypothetical protein JSV65_12310 [Armatimonadota bacterium]